MSVPLGWKPPRREVPCSGKCGRTVSRTSHFATAVCHDCNNKRRCASKSPRQRRIAQEARRYRILLAVGPYKTWQELLSALRLRNPHTRALSYDLAVERRYRGNPQC